MDNKRHLIYLLTAVVLIIGFFLCIDDKISNEAYLLLAVVSLITNKILTCKK